MSGICTCGHVPERHVDGRCQATVSGPERGRGIQCDCYTYQPRATSTEPDPLAQMADPEHYQAVVAVPHTETHPCVVQGCRISQEEHHRLMKGILDENATLKRRVAELERGQA